MLSDSRERGGVSEQETENKESKKICSNSLWMCSGASTIPQPMNRLCCHYSAEKTMGTQQIQK